MIVSFTGHRPTKIGGYDILNPIYEACHNSIMKALNDLNPTQAISGMALGVDTWAALCCVELGIPFIAAIPFEGQEKRWPDRSQRLYNVLLKEAFKKEYICDPGYAFWKMQKRNEWMVDNSDLVIAVWDGSSGGTGHCVDYALKNEKKIYWINPKLNFEHKYIAQGDHE